MTEPEESDIAARAEMLARLLPPGPAWTHGTDGLARLLRALGTELARVTDDLEALVENFFPDTTLDFLPDWERILKLSAADMDETERQRQVLARLRGYGDPNVLNIQAIAQAFDPNAAIVNRPYQQFQVGYSSVGQAVCGDGFTSTFMVLGEISAALIAAINAAKPLHTTAEFVQV